MADGSVETHPLTQNPLIVRQEGPNSKDLRVLVATEANEARRVIGTVVVFGCHATVMERDNELISADFPGRVRDYVSARFAQTSSGTVPSCTVHHCRHRVSGAISGLK